MVTGADACESLVTLDYNLFTFNGEDPSERPRSPFARTIGAKLAELAYCWSASSNQEFVCLAWNFTIASLLGRAADQERERRQVSVRIEVPDLLAYYWPDVLALNLSAAAYVQDELRKQNATTQVLLP